MIFGEKFLEGCYGGFNGIEGYVKHTVNQEIVVDPYFKIGFYSGTGRKFVKIWSYCLAKLRYYAIHKKSNNLINDIKNQEI